MTAGSRGDEAPYTGLGLGLLRAGHEVTLVTHGCFAPLVADSGPGFRPLPVDPRAELPSARGRALHRSTTGVGKLLRVLSMARAPAGRMTDGLVTAARECGRSHQRDQHRTPPSRRRRSPCPGSRRPGHRRRTARHRATPGSDPGADSRRHGRSAPPRGLAPAGRAASVTRAGEATATGGDRVPGSCLRSSSRRATPVTPPPAATPRAAGCPAVAGPVRPPPRPGSPVPAPRSSRGSAR
ncbi:hypothetical protein IPT68_33285 [Streptomyces chromofuscus]|uniref:Glycosyltransferase family 28 N-terminal domain-containing protein n=1 Tax=Streptomyces chromofuscus TaxID=42881 RepID=A0A7M2TGL0_STRCW|nr:hypothetical protein IPT68_33285 [Streptomyces chromofuscus]